MKNEQNGRVDTRISQHWKIDLELFVTVGHELYSNERSQKPYEAIYANRILLKWLNLYVANYIVYYMVNILEICFILFLLLPIPALFTNYLMLVIF